jgi:hypothetical protein
MIWCAEPGGRSWSGFSQLNIYLPQGSPEGVYEVRIVATLGMQNANSKTAFRVDLLPTRPAVGDSSPFTIGWAVASKLITRRRLWQGRANTKRN